MNWGIVRLLYQTEMRMLLRDRRMVITSIVIPILVMPLMLYATQFAAAMRERSGRETTYNYAITGSWSAEARGLIARALTADTTAARDFKSQEIQTPDPERAARSGELHFYIQALNGAEADVVLQKEEQEEKRKQQARNTPARSQQPDPRRIEPPKRPGGTPLLRLHYMGNRENASRGRNQMRNLIAAARWESAGLLLRDRGLPIDTREIFALDVRNLATAAEVTGSSVGRFLTLFVLILLLAGGAAAAMDIIAGEKERGTLETLLTTAAGRGEIVAAKQFVIISVGLFIAVLQVANLLVYLTLRVIELPRDFVIEVPPTSILALALLYIPMAAFVAAVLLAISGFAKSYKEAQMVFLPVYLVSLVPALASVLPGLPLRSLIVAVPVANVSVAAREILVGRLDWPMIVVAAAVMAAAAALMVRISAGTLSNERLITATQFEALETDLARSPLARNVLKWFIVMWALLFGAAVGVPELATFRRQLLFNEFVLLLLPCLLIVWKYRLKPREVFSLRPVKPIAWLATLMLIPSGLIVASGAGELASRVLPVPRQMLEQFGRMIFPAEIPTWQLLLYIAILPGIVEELAFRGILLHGLRHRVRPWLLPLVVGGIFGFFHVDLFRLAPTATLGVVLTAVTMLTGSIFPAMLIHATSNSLGVVLNRAGVDFGYDPWLVVSGVAVFVLAFYILYRNRVVYENARPLPPGEGGAIAPGEGTDRK